TFRRTAAEICAINQARQPLIDSNESLQTRALQNAIAHDAYLAATDMDQAATTRDPKRAAIKARYLETARKASSTLPGCHHSPQRGAVVPPNQPSTLNPVPPQPAVRLLRSMERPPLPATTQHPTINTKTPSSPVSRGSAMGGTGEVPNAVRRRGLFNRNHPQPAVRLWQNGGNPLCPSPRPRGEVSLRSGGATEGPLPQKQLLSSTRYHHARQRGTVAPPTHHPP
ncbi:MAG: hypothetical protein CMJ25_02535, partial [Phycisphaerae bacterium]|nr:hypothetical protein [Phycisphaerae bacterium]